MRGRRQHTLLDSNNIPHKHLGKLVELLAAEIVAADIQRLWRKQSDFLFQFERLHRVRLQRRTECPASQQLFRFRHDFATTAFDGRSAHASEADGFGGITTVEIVVVAF